MYRAHAPLQLTDCAEIGRDDLRCLAPAVVHRLPPLRSTGGPMELVATRCVFGHVLRMPTSMLVGAA